MVQTPSPLPTSHYINYRCAAISDLRNVDGLLRDASPGKPRRGRVACACGRGRAHPSEPLGRRVRLGRSFCSVCFNQRLQT